MALAGPTLADALTTSIVACRKFDSPELSVQITRTVSGPSCANLCFRRKGLRSGDTRVGAEPSPQSTASAILSALSPSIRRPLSRIDLPTPTFLFRTRSLDSGGLGLRTAPLKSLTLAIGAKLIVTVGSNVEERVTELVVTV